VNSTFKGMHGPVRDIVLLNAAAGLVAFALAGDPGQAQIPIVQRFRDKLTVAAEAIDSGAATAKLTEWVAATRSS
jgi:anthranilate phosphoribosyltransferase